MDDYNCKFVYDIGNVKITILKGTYYVYWNIDEYFIRAPAYADVLVSRSFYMWDEPWNFYLLPSGNSDGLIGIRLKSENLRTIKPVFCTFGVAKGDGSVYKYSEPKIITGGKFLSADLLRRSELDSDRKLIGLDGHVTFYAIIRLPDSGGKERLLAAESQNTAEKSEEKEIYEVTDKNDEEDDKRHEVKDGEDFFGAKDIAVLTQSLENALINEINSDVELKVGERQFKAHKMVLSVRSAVFASMFKHDTIESRSGVINIPDCDPEAFQDFLSYIYTAKIDNFSESNAVELYYIADKYDVKQLALQCIAFLVKNISVESFCDVLTLAVRHKEPGLIEAAEDFFAKNMQQILVNVKWHSFMKENTTVANELFIKCAKKFNL